MKKLTFMSLKDLLASLAVVAVASLSVGSDVSADVIVYQDTFADGDLASNADGIGGGLDSGTGGQTNTPWLEQSGSLDTNPSTGGGNNARAWTTSSYSIADGFSLDVTFSATSFALSGNPPFPANGFSFGLLDVADNDGSGYFSGGPATLYGIGVDFDLANTQGLTFLDGVTSANLVNGADQLVDVGANQTLNLTVDANGNYSYSLNGAVATTGVTTFDLTRDYQFAAYTQGGDGGSSIQDVTLTALAAPTAVPEPGSFAALGLLAVGMVTRRRRS